MLAQVQLDRAPESTIRPRNPNTWALGDTVRLDLYGILAQGTVIGVPDETGSFWLRPTFDVYHVEIEGLIFEVRDGKAL